MAAKFVDAPNFLWQIDHLFSTEKELSPILYSLGLKWQLTFNRYTDTGYYCFSLFLECLSAPEPSTKFQFKAVVYFIHIDGRRSCLTDSKCNFTDKKWRVWKDKVQNFRSEFPSSLANVIFGVLITPCEGLERIIKIQKTAEEVDLESFWIKSLTEDLEKLFISGEHGDFILKCGKKSFSVHKGILSARSEFFAGMFRSNMKEANESTGKIEDLEPDILELILRYIYTGEIPEFPKESIREIYIAADKFDIKCLKYKCCLLFIDNFITDTEEGSEKETKSDKTNQKQLIRNLFLTREWKSVYLELPHIAEELVRPLILQM